MNEVGGVCSTYWGSICVYRVLVRTPEEKHLEDPGVDWRIILRYTFRK
jgi:hypothetical protein